MTSARAEDEFRRIQREQDNLLEENPGHHAAVYRRALIFTPFAIAFLVAFSWTLRALLAGNLGALIGCVLLGLIAFALSYEGVAALRDLRTQPMRSSGPLDRVWTKSKFLVFGKSGYLLLNRRVFEIRVDTSMLMESGQLVTIEHWPHTNIVVTLHRDRGSSSMD